MIVVSRTDAPWYIAALISVGTALHSIVDELLRLNRFALDQAAPDSPRRERAAMVIAELDRLHRHPNRCC
jgi:hypothetical protein